MTIEQSKIGKAVKETSFPVKETDVPSGTQTLIPLKEPTKDEIGGSVELQPDVWSFLSISEQSYIVQTDVKFGLTNPINTEYTGALKPVFTYIVPGEPQTPKRISHRIYVDSTNGDMFRAGDAQVSRYNKSINRVIPKDEVITFSMEQNTGEPVTVGGGDSTVKVLSY